MKNDLYLNLVKSKESKTPIGVFMDTKKLVYNDTSIDIFRGEPVHIMLITRRRVKKGDDCILMLKNGTTLINKVVNVGRVGKNVVAELDFDLPYFPVHLCKPLFSTSDPEITEVPTMDIDIIKDIIESHNLSIDEKNKPLD